MRLFVITLALASLSLSLAQPTPPTDIADASALDNAPVHVAELKKPSHQVVAAQIKKRQTSRQDILARQAARGLLTARKGPRRASGGDVQSYFKRNVGDDDDEEEEDEEKERESEAKCEGGKFSYFANVSWKTPTESQDLGRFFSKDGAPYPSWECARRCNETTGCSYASLFENMCELTSLTNVDLKLGGSYQSILPGSCRRNIKQHGLPSYTPCEELCFIQV